MNDILAPLRIELDQWTRAGRTAQFWWRDDDATVDCPALLPLIDLAHGLSIPCVLAVIPAGLEDSLIERIRDDNFITPVQHGFSHTNYAPTIEKKHELGNHRPLPDIEQDLTEGRKRLADAFPRFFPVMVPPWNRMHPDVLGLLEGLSYRGLSTFGRQHFDTVIPQVNVHVDVIDWRGDRCQKSLAVLVHETVAHLREKRDTEGVWQEPTGIMTHHKDQQAAGWNVLRLLFETILDQGGVFLDAPDIFGKQQ